MPAKALTSSPLGLSTDPDKIRKIMVSEEELEEGDLDLDWFDFQLKHDLILVGSP